MKNITKKFISAALSVIISVTVLSSFIAEVEADPASASGNVQQRIVQLSQLFPNGSYFSKNNLACPHSTLDKCDNCYLDSIMKGNPKLGYPDAKGNAYSCNTCVAFARFAYFYVFAQPWDEAGFTSKSSNAVVVDSAADALPGDIFVWEKPAHWAMYLGNSKFFHSNVTGTNQVSYNTAFNGTLYKIYRSDNYNQINNNNTSFAAAAAIPLMTAAKVYVTATGEKRYYSFTPSSTSFYTIESSANGTYDPYVKLYNSSQVLLGSFDNINSSISNKNFRLGYHLEAGQKYYVEASCASGTGNYQFSISITTNLDIISSLLITIPSTFSVNISNSYQRSNFLFTPSATKTYIIESSGTADPKGWLYNTYDTLIASDDDGAGGLNFRIEATLTAGQKYYLAAGCFTNKTGSYTASIKAK